MMFSISRPALVDLPCSEENNDSKNQNYHPYTLFMQPHKDLRLLAISGIWAQIFRNGFVIIQFSSP